MSALPDGSRLLHIGPHKTGTTTVQAAFDQNRDRLAEYGVHYAGRKAHSMTAAIAAATGGALASDSVDAGAERWRALTAEVAASDARVTVLSSEFYSEARPERIRGILDALGADRTHVVVTLRPLSRILASQWQQYMQNRPLLKYDDDLDYAGWLDRVLRHPDDPGVTPSFWWRHRHDRVVRDWAEQVGADRTTVVVVDESDRRMLMRTFEELVDVPEGTLEPHDLAANRSLTVPEVELLRGFNRHFVQQGWSHADYTRYVRFGAARVLQERAPGPAEERLLTPPWAVELASELGAEMAAAIATTGVRVIGDLSVLGDPSVARGVGENTADPAVPAEITARFTAGLVALLAQTPAGPARRVRRPGPVEAALRRELALREGESDLPDLRRELALREGESDLSDLRRRIAGAEDQVARSALVDELSRTALLTEVARRGVRRVRAAVRRRTRRP